MKTMIIAFLIGAISFLLVSLEAADAELHRLSSVTADAVKVKRENKIICASFNELVDADNSNIATIYRLIHQVKPQPLVYLDCLDTISNGGR